MIEPPWFRIEIGRQQVPGAEPRNHLAKLPNERQ
jgi:hypothetical protein